MRIVLRGAAHAAGSRETTITSSTIQVSHWRTLWAARVVTIEASHCDLRHGLQFLPRRSIPRQDRHPALDCLDEAGEGVDVRAGRKLAIRHALIQSRLQPLQAVEARCTDNLAELSVAFVADHGQRDHAASWDVAQRTGQ